jgi:hypothetical protein
MKLPRRKFLHLTAGRGCAADRATCGAGGATTNELIGVRSSPGPQALQIRCRFGREPWT